jgi:hypothetical protein
VHAIKALANNHEARTSHGLLRTQRRATSFVAGFDPDSELVVDLWGGHRDAAPSTRWRRDATVIVFSTTKRQVPC